MHPAPWIFVHLTKGNSVLLSFIPRHVNTQTIHSLKKRRRDISDYHATVLIYPAQYSVYHCLPLVHNSSPLYRPYLLSHLIPRVCMHAFRQT
jgi:hypothetical protein